MLSFLSSIFEKPLTFSKKHDIILRNDAWSDNAPVIFSEESMDDGDADDCQHCTVITHINLRYNRA